MDVIFFLMLFTAMTLTRLSKPHATTLNTSTTKYVFFLPLCQFLFSMFPCSEKILIYILPTYYLNDLRLSRLQSVMVAHQKQHARKNPIFEI